MDDHMLHFVKCLLFFNSLCDTRVLVACTMLEDWEAEQAVYDNDKGGTTPSCHPRRNRECFSTPHTARDPNKIEEVELESEDLQEVKIAFIITHKEIM